MTTRQNCPICRDFRGVDLDVEFDTHTRRVSCPRCGRFRITERASEALGTRTFRSTAYLLSAATRYASDRDEELLLKEAELDDHIRSVDEPAGIQAAADRLLRWVGDRSGSFGSAVKMSGGEDYPTIAVKDAAEFDYVRGHLLDRGLIRAQRTLGAGYEVTPDGWERLDRIGRVTGRSRNAFVAMSFAPDLRPAYDEGIHPAVEATGYSPVRVDSVEHIGKIDDRIIAEIRQSRFLIADCTLQRPGVYFEAGFALGLGLPVIWSCRTDDVENLHFDTRQYNHIVWATPEDLRNKLSIRIVAAIGRGDQEG